MNDNDLDRSLNIVIAALRGTKAASILADDVGGGIERLRSQLLSERALVKKLDAELDRLRWERDKAVQLLHMLDRPEARHPDVGEFLDALGDTGRQ